MNLVFATNNLHKLAEVQEMTGNIIFLKSLADIGCEEDIPETGETLDENALQKADYIHQKFNVNVFADDTGLEVEALNGAPGVYSARYAGPERDATNNIKMLLSELKGKENRKARFRTVISLILNNEVFHFEGVVNGVITEKASGLSGFGYDPVFVPDGFDETFAEMSAVQKNEISHRGRAMRALVDFLKSKA
jgi:XTP/dITP diphosphohydrolase